MYKLMSLLFAFALVSCSKDEFNPSDPRNGQKVELFVDHYNDVRNQMVFLLPGGEPSPLPLGGFEERKLGYTYKVKAKVRKSSQPVMDDGVNSWFEYTNLINKERYAGTESFEIGLVYPLGFGSGGSLAVRKEGEQLEYGGSGNLRPVNLEVKRQLEDLLSREKEINSSEEYSEYREYMSKLALRAVVSHDPENWGSGYLVHEIKFNK